MKRAQAPRLRFVLPLAFASLAWAGTTAPVLPISGVTRPLTVMMAYLVLVIVVVAALHAEEVRDGRGER